MVTSPASLAVGPQTLLCRSMIAGIKNLFGIENRKTLFVVIHTFSMLFRICANRRLVSFHVSIVYEFTC